MISVKTENEIAIMRQGGKILAEVLAEVAKNAKPGVTTAFLNELAHDLILAKGASPGFLGFDGYPASLCASINEQVVHALPLERKLKEGDIISLDLGVLYPVSPDGGHCGSCPMAGGCGEKKGMYTDAAITVGVGETSQEAKKLIETARMALNDAIDLTKPGQKLSKISEAIQRRAEQAGFSVIRELVGHGVGYELHEDPPIPNFTGHNFKDIVLKEGMVLAIEPMLAAGKWRIKKSPDGYGFETKDKSLAAHFEHTVAVTKIGAEILTKI